MSKFNAIWNNRLKSLDFWKQLKAMQLNGQLSRLYIAQEVDKLERRDKRKKKSKK